MGLAYCQAIYRKNTRLLIVEIRSWLALVLSLAPWPGRDHDKALYGLKSSGAAFRAHLAETLYDIGLLLNKADPDVWYRPAVNPNGIEYCEYILYYVDDILCR